MREHMTGQLVLTKLSAGKTIVPTPDDFKGGERYEVFTSLDLQQMFKKKKELYTEINKEQIAERVAQLEEAWKYITLLNRRTFHRGWQHN